jgi:16S rRNA (adenine1518-N6/adenine1519-N6)-dimethyltransferase
MAAGLTHTAIGWRAIVGNGMDETPSTKKSLGQHWLQDTAALEAIAGSVQVGASDTILEIGPGPGSLTSILCHIAEQVVAVEFDERLAAELPKRVPADNLQVVTRDILRFDFSQLPRDYKIVANIPYYLTSNLVRVISETPNPPSAAALLIQKEVAERAAAPPGAMSILSVTAQFYWRVSLGQVVPAELFTPPPKVDSQVLILERRPVLLFEDVDARRFFRLVKAGFAQRRKTLLNSLGAGLQLSREQTQALCQTAGVDSGRRAQSLSLPEWQALYLAFETSKNNR